MKREHSLHFSEYELPNFEIDDEDELVLLPSVKRSKTNLLVSSGGIGTSKEADHGNNTIDSNSFLVELDNSSFKNALQVIRNYFEQLQNTKKELQLARKELIASEKKNIQFEEASIELNNSTNEKLRVESENHEKALKLANGQLQVVRVDFVTMKDKYNAIASDAKKLKAEREGQLQKTKKELQHIRAELIFIQEKNIQFEVTSNEWKKTNEKLRLESEKHEEDLKLANAQLRDAQDDIANYKGAWENRGKDLTREEACHINTQAKLTAAKEKNVTLEVAANEWKNTTEKLRVESEHHVKALKLANDQLQVARFDLATTKEKNTALAATIKRLRAERVGQLKKTNKELQLVRAELSATQEKIIQFEVSSNEWKNTNEKIRLESEKHEKDLNLVNAQLQLARAEIANYKKDENILYKTLEAAWESRGRALTLEKACHLSTQAELTAAKQKNITLEVAANKWKNTAEKFRVECQDNKKAFNMAKTEREVLRNLVASSPAAVDTHLIDASLKDISAEVGRNPESLRNSYSKCVRENRQLKMEVETQRTKLEICQEQSWLNQTKLNDKNKELKTKLCEMEGNLDILGKQLEEKADDMQDMESLNQVMLLKEIRNNTELQEARIELKRGLENVLSQHSLFGIKRMGELNSKPFLDACMQKFPSKDLEIKSTELCSLWQENIKDHQWFPFKTIQMKGKCDEVIDDSDEKLKQLKDAWGEHVYKAVCVALSEINEYNPSTRCAVPEIWNFKEDRKASLKEVTGYLLNELNVLKGISVDDDKAKNATQPRLVLQLRN